MLAREKQGRLRSTEPLTTEAHSGILAALFACASSSSTGVVVGVGVDGGMEKEEEE